MVARCWGCDHVPPTFKHREQDAGDRKGPPRRSSTLAPTDGGELCVRLMPIGGPFSFRLA